MAKQAAPGARVPVRVEAVSWQSSAAAQKNRPDLRHGRQVRSGDHQPTRRIRLPIMVRMLTRIAMELIVEANTVVLTVTLSDRMRQTRQTI